MSPRDALRRALAAARAPFVDPDELDLTDGPIGRPLLLLSTPIIVTNLLQVAYNLADTFWLGRYSTDALAAITFGFPAVFFLISLGMGVAATGSVLVAQYTGAGQPRAAQHAAGQTVSYAVLLALGLGTLGVFVVEPFLQLLGASPDVLPGATAYLQVMSVGIVTIFAFMVFVALMRGAGDTVTPMLVMAGTVALNVVIDPVLIFGVGPVPELGVRGAAVATVFSRGLAAAVGLAIMIRGRRGVELHLPDLVPDPDYLPRLIRIGGPATVESTARSVSVIGMLAIVGTFATPVVAAFGVGVRVFSVIFMPAIAVDRGVETMTGQNVGAGKPDRAARANHLAAGGSFAVLSVAGLVTILAAPGVVNLFSPDAQVVAVGAEFLRWVAPTFGCIGVVRAYSGGFRGAGRTLSAAVLALLMLGVFRLPVSYVASRVVDVSTLAVSLPGLGTLETTVLANTPVAALFAASLGPRGIWLGFVVSNVLAAAIALAWFRRGTWRDADLTEDAAVAPPEPVTD